MKSILKHIRLALVVMMAAALCLIAPAGAQARSHHDHQERVAVKEISVQMWNFFVYIGSDASAAAQARQEEVLGRLAGMGYRNIEALDYTNFQGLGAPEYRALLDKYGLKASGLHTSLSMATTDAQWATALTTAKTLGVKYIGAGATPRTFTTKQEWIDYAKKTDRFGKMARQRGIQYMVHSHNWEFTSVYNGMTAYDILQKYTSAKNVVFELDLYWTTQAGTDPAKILKKYDERIVLLHVKDMAADTSITTVGEGTIDFPRLFAAAGTDIRYYVIERDPPFDGTPFDPFTVSKKGFDYLKAVTFRSHGH